MLLLDQFLQAHVYDKIMQSILSISFIGLTYRPRSLTSIFSKHNILCKTDDGLKICGLTFCEKHKWSTFPFSLATLL